MSNDKTKKAETNSSDGGGNASSSSVRNDIGFHLEALIKSRSSNEWKKARVDFKANRVIDKSRQRLPLRILDDRQCLACPACECDNTHLEDASFRKGNDGYEAHDHVRGDVVSIKGYCEYGCLFTLFLGQHKGDTVMWCERQSYLIPNFLAPVCVVFRDP